MRCNDQGTEFEFTVFQIPAKGREVLKLNQGFPGNRGNFCRVSFFVSFLEKQKEKYLLSEILQK